MVLYLCVFLVFSLHPESLKIILVDEPLPKVVLSQLKEHMTYGYYLLGGLNLSKNLCISYVTIIHSIS
jgi:hypothetical protein